MAWGQEKGADVKISALPVSMRFFDFVPCSLPLKTLILLTFLCFLIRRRGREVAFPYIYILYLFSGTYSLPARRWDRAAEICAFFSPTMSYLNMGKMDSSASTPGRAV